MDFYEGVEKVRTVTAANVCQRSLAATAFTSLSELGANYQMRDICHHSPFEGLICFTPDQNILDLPLFLSQFLLKFCVLSILIPVACLQLLYWVNLYIGIYQHVVGLNDHMHLVP